MSSGVQILGLACANAVLSASPYRGRVFAAISGHGGTPSYTHSTAEGAPLSWQTPVPFASYGPPPSPDFGSLPGTQYRTGFRPTAYPSVAVGQDGKTVYVAFIGIDSEEPESPDIFVAVSHTGGDSFVAADIFRLYDDNLLLPGESPHLRYQAMPSLAIDGMGGINLIWAETPGNVDGPVTATIRYARFNNTAALAGSASYTASLTPTPFPINSDFNIGLLSNDYQMLAASGCVLYAAYARTDPVNPSPTARASSYAEL